MKEAPEALDEILVYHSGENKYTSTTEKKMGKEKINAIGKPRSNLLLKELYSTLTDSQCFKKADSDSVNIFQKYKDLLKILNKSSIELKHEK